MDEPWIINRVRDPGDETKIKGLEAANERLKEELTKKPESAKPSYEALFAEIDIYKAKIARMEKLLHGAKVIVDYAYTQVPYIRGVWLHTLREWFDMYAEWKEEDAE